MITQPGTLPVSKCLAILYSYMYIDSFTSYLLRHQLVTDVLIAPYREPSINQKAPE